MGNSLITIGKGPKLQGASTLSLIAPCYFCAGILSSWLGGIWLGVRLWLTRHGILSTPVNYAELLSAHALIQIYLSLGFFLIGFCYHAVPKVLQVKINVSQRLAWSTFLLLILGAMLITLTPREQVGRFLLMLGYCCVSIFLVRLLLVAEKSAQLRVGLHLLVGLCVLTVGTLLNPRKPEVALTLLWSGVGAMVFGASQQFLFAFLGCEKLRERAALRSCGFHLVAASLLLSQHFKTFGILALVQVFGFIFATKSWRLLPKILTSMGSSFAFSFFWMVVAAFCLMKDEPNYDAAVHALSLGMAYTVIIGTSSQILGFMNLKQILPERWLTLLILVWQLAVLGRVWSVWSPGNPWQVGLTGVASSIVLLTWGAALISSALELFQKTRRTGSFSK